MASPTPIDPRDQALLSLLPRNGRGYFKVYLGSAAGVGKTVRMLQEAHDLRQRGVDVVVGFIETHGRAETAALVRDLDIVPRTSMTYRDVTLEEMDLSAVLARAPQVALVDELAHNNVPGSVHRKRWEDVLDLLEAGISVVSAMNVQHVESIAPIVQQALGVIVRETVPDWVLGRADQVVNIDIPADELRRRLIDGKIYALDKVPTALDHFFTAENLTTLRELALREAASSVDRERMELVRRETGRSATVHASADRLMVAMASHPPRTAALLHKARRIAGRLNSDWYCVYVQTPSERADRIDTTIQRALVANIQLAQRMGAEVVKLEDDDVAAAIIQFARREGVSLVLVGRSERSWWHRIRHGSVVDRLLSHDVGLDVLIVS
jgi:two-component system sensor histidine kinase KdpD